MELCQSPNQSVNRSWLAFRFFKLAAFDYNCRFANVYSIGPPTRLPQSLGFLRFKSLKPTYDRTLLSKCGRKMGKSFEAVFSPQCFEPFPTISDNHDFDDKWKTNRPWVLSNMAHAAYLREKDIEELMGKIGAEAFTFNEGGAQAFLAEWPDQGILAFRGSEPIERRPTFIRKFLLKKFLKVDLDPRILGFLNNDVIADLKFRKVEFDGFQNVKIHRGFLGEINKLWKGILRRLGNLKEQIPVSVTGHSLGAAMATLAGMRYPFEEVVTFGEPRVGCNVNLAFQAKSHTRYVNGDDPVTKVPPELFFGYDHHGDVVMISDPGGGTDFRYDHSIVYYSENLA